MTDAEPLFVPSDEAWEYFEEHSDDIRDIIAQFANGELRKYDDLAEQMDTHGMIEIMNHAWSAAPDDRSIMNIPGFREMCNLLDGTIEGFFQEGFDNLKGMDLSRAVESMTKKDEIGRV